MAGRFGVFCIGVANNFPTRATWVPGDAFCSSYGGDAFIAGHEAQKETVLAAYDAFQRIMAVA